MQLGTELQPILDHLRQVYPGGVVPESDYWPLLVVLLGDMSVEALSQVVAELIDSEIVIIENDAADAASRRRPLDADVERVRNLMLARGWVPEEG